MACYCREMPYPWRKALCERTQLSNSVFLGELLSVISESAKYKMLRVSVEQAFLRRILRSHVLLCSALGIAIRTNYSRAIGGTSGKRQSALLFLPWRLPCTPQ
jgi:hypothetical protein